MQKIDLTRNSDEVDILLEVRLESRLAERERLLELESAGDRRLVGPAEAVWKKRYRIRTQVQRGVVMAKK